MGAKWGTPNRGPCLWPTRPTHGCPDLTAPAHPPGLPSLAGGTHPCDLLLLMACSENDDGKVTELLKAGADPTIKVGSGRWCTAGCAAGCTAGRRDRAAARCRQAALLLALNG